MGALLVLVVFSAVATVGVVLVSRARRERVRHLMALVGAWLFGGHTVDQVARAVAAALRVACGDVLTPGRYHVHLPVPMWNAVRGDLDRLERAVVGVLWNDSEGAFDEAEVRLTFASSRRASVGVTRDIPYAGGTKPVAQHLRSEAREAEPSRKGPVERDQGTVPVGYLVVGDLRIPLLRGGPLTIGRSPDSDVVVNDDYVSERHAVVEADAHSPIIIDQRSTNGTWVNGNAVGVARLADGDAILVGKTAFAVELGGLVPGAGGAAGAAQVVVASHAQERAPEGDNARSGDDSPAKEPPRLDEVERDRTATDLRFARTAPMTTSFDPPRIGDAGGGAVTWGLQNRGLGNYNLAVLGAPGTGKTQVVAGLLRQLPDATRLMIIDPKGEYAGLELPDMTCFEPWRAPIPYNPLVVADTDGRAAERLAIDLRDAIAQAFLTRGRLGHRQIARIASALNETLAVNHPSMTTLHELLDDDLVAVLGDLTGGELFGAGPPVTSMLDERVILDLAAIPGNGVTGELLVAFVLVAACVRVGSAPFADGTVRFVVVVDEAHRVGRLAALERLAREGRAKGLSVVTCTQHPADLPDALAAQAATTVCFRLHGPAADVAAGRLGGGSKLATTIRRLPAGHAVVAQGSAAPVVVDTTNNTSGRAA